MRSLLRCTSSAGCTVSILNAPSDERILKVAARTGFLLLSEQPDRELVIGIVVISSGGVERPFAARAVQRACSPWRSEGGDELPLEDASEGACLVFTETRVHATDAAARHRFAPYWTVIRPGSGFIRRMWLRAIKRRAESYGSGSQGS